MCGEHQNRESPCFLKGFCEVHFFTEPGKHRYFTSWHQRGLLKTKAVASSRLFPAGWGNSSVHQHFQQQQQQQQQQQFGLFALPSDTMLAESLRTLLSLTSEVTHSLWGAASRRLTGSLQRKVLDLQMWAAVSSARCCRLPSPHGGWEVVFVSAGRWAFIQRANGRRLRLLTRSSPPRLYNCLEYINSSCRARPFFDWQLTSPLTWQRCCSFHQCRSRRVKGAEPCR